MAPLRAWKIYEERLIVGPADMIVPVLSKTFPDQNLPTVLRSSSLSILSTCAEADPLALTRYSDDLVNAAIDLIQIESVPSSSFRPPPVQTPSLTEEEKGTAAHRKKKVVLIEDDESDLDEPTDEKHTAEIDRPRIVDPEPTSRGDSKHPTLRRSALTFLGHLLLATVNDQTEEHQRQVDKATSTSSNNIGLEGAMFQMRLPGQAPIMHGSSTLSIRGGTFMNAKTMNKAETVLGYVALTDDDEIVRAQAREVGLLLSELKL